MYVQLYTDHKKVYILHNALQMVSLKELHIVDSSNGYVKRTTMILQMITNSYDHSNVQMHIVLHSLFEGSSVAQLH